MFLSSSCVSDRHVFCNGPLRKRNLEVNVGESLHTAYLTSSILAVVGQATIEESPQSRIPYSALLKTLNSIPFDANVSYKGDVLCADIARRYKDIRRYACWAVLVQVHHLLE